MSKFPMHEPFTFSATASDGAITGVIKNFNLQAQEANIPFTPASMGKMAGFTGVTCPVGTPEMVADEMAKWLEETDVDGFNCVCEFYLSNHSVWIVVRETNMPTDNSNPVSYEDIVDLLVPVLQERGLMWKDYTVPGGCYRENLHNTPGNPYLNARHPGSKVSYRSTDEAETKEEKVDVVA